MDPRFPWYKCTHAPLVGGVEWSSDGRSAFRDAPMSADPKRGANLTLDGMLKFPLALAADVHRENGHAIIDARYVFAEHYLDLAEAVSPGVTWYLSIESGDVPPLVGKVGDAPVAIIMGMRRTPAEVREGLTGYPPCPKCEGTGHAEVCRVCDGSGESECAHCGHEGTCDACDGEGGEGLCDACEGQKKWRRAA